MFTDVNRVPPEKAPEPMDVTPLSIATEVIELRYAPQRVVDEYMLVICPVPLMVIAPFASNVATILVAGFVPQFHVSVGGVVPMAIIRRNVFQELTYSYTSSNAAGTYKSAVA
jgi:hypothetical protein